MQKNNPENVFFYCDNCIWIDCVKLFLLRREFFSWELNVLTDSLKVFLITNRHFSFSIAFTIINKNSKGTVVQISTVFGPVSFLLLEVSSKIGIFRQLSNHIFRSPTFWKYISYECHLFFENAQNLI